MSRSISKTLVETVGRGEVHVETFEVLGGHHGEGMQGLWETRKTGLFIDRSDADASLVSYARRRTG